jgi:cyclophilin family peptidyl-prolyl cis-trans isomerase
MTPTTALVFLSVLFPAKGWFSPDQAWNVNVRPPQGTAVRLVLTDFSGTTIDAVAGAERDFDKDGAADLKHCFPAITTGGCYILYAIPRPAGPEGESRENVGTFVGTPLVITVREDHRAGAPTGPMAVKVEPLCFAIVSTGAGDMTVGFYYDSAPNNIANFIALARDGFYDGLTFHRVEPDFLVQGGDPRGDGTGGPGYSVDSEFSDRKHRRGVVSMARNVDPNEAPNSPPRPEYANSAGSQFFITLNRKNGAQLDGVYTVVGRVVGTDSTDNTDSLRTLDKLAATPLADPKTGKPAKPPLIRKVEVRPVTQRENPYTVLQAQATEKEEGEEGTGITVPAPDGSGKVAAPTGGE